MATGTIYGDPARGPRAEKADENFPPSTPEWSYFVEMDEDDVLEGMLPEAFDEDGDPITYALIDGPNHGVATVQSGGRFTYQPPQDFVGLDVFSFQVSDGRGGYSGPVTMSITVKNVNDEPVVGGGSSIAGNPVVGQTLEGFLPFTDADGIDWLTANAAFRWEYANPSLLNWQAIPGSPAGINVRLLTVTDFLVGSVVRYALEYTDLRGTQEFVATAPTTPVTSGGPPPVINGGDGSDALVDASPGGSELWGQGGNDTLTGGAGNDSLFGGAGIDVAVYSGNRSNYSVTLNTSPHSVDVVVALSGVEGTDHLTGIERLWFADRKLAIDFGPGGHAEITARILGAVFGPAAVANAEYAGIGLTLLDAGFDYASLMQLALDARLGAGFSNEQMVALLLGNLGVAPDPGLVAEFSGLIVSGVFTQVSLAMFAADHPLNTDRIGLAGLEQSGLEYF